MLKPKTKISYFIKIKENGRIQDFQFDFGTHEYLLISKWLYNTYLSEFKTKYTNLIYKELSNLISDDNTQISLLVHDLINEKHLNREYIIVDPIDIEYEWTPDFNENVNKIITLIQRVVLNSQLEV